MECKKSTVKQKSLICLLILIFTFPLISTVIPIYIQRSKVWKEETKVPQLKNNGTRMIKIKKMGKFYQRDPYSSEISEKSISQKDLNLTSPIKADIQSGASNWGASSFKYRKNITIDCSKVPADLNDFPVLVTLYDNDLRYHTQADGDDIYFIDEFNKTIDHELEHFDVTYNETHAFMVTWIRIPILSGSLNTTISMYYGNSTIGNQENVTGVWGNGNYVGVWHMDNTLQESSTRGNDGINQGSIDEIGKIGRARGFDGIDDYISLGVWDPVIGSGSYSISAWVRLNNTFNSTSGESMPILGHYDSDIYNMVFAFAGQDNSHGNNGILYSKVEGAAGDGYDYIDSNKTSWPGETWIYVAGVANQSSGIGRIYVNGISEGNMSNSGTPSFGTTGDYQIGRVWIEQTSGDEKFEGVIDEVRLFKGVYSTEWLLTEYRNQNDPHGFYSIGLEENRDEDVPTGEGVGIEVIIDTDVYDAIDEYNPGPNVVFVNNSHGYVFFQKTNGGLSEIVYYKTIDNGTSWIGPANIDCGPPTFIFRSFSCWFDQWTPNNLGTKIHFIVNSINYDEMMYNYLDTKDDSTGGTWLKVMDSGGSHNAPDGGGAVTISTDGKIFGASWMTNGPQFAKFDSSWYDITPSYSFLNDDDDHGQLFPLGGGDILCIYEDATDNILYSFVYDEDTDIWDASPTQVTTITSETEAPEDAYNNNANWGAVLNPNTHSIYLVLNNDILSSDGDLETWEFFDSNRTWRQKTNVATNVGAQGDEVKPAYDPNSNTLFVISIDGQNIHITNSTDGGGTWGSVEKLSTANENWIVVRTNFISTERIYAIYFDDVNNDVYGNTVVDLPKPLGKAIIEVNVIDLDNREVPNAKVTLMNAFNSSIFTFRNTTTEGYTSFTDVIFDEYNLTVEFEDSINNTFSFQPIFSNTSYHLKPNFEYIIGITEYIDNEIPIVQDIYYENKSVQFANSPVFFADVIDESSLRVVNLSLTVINVTSEEPVIQGNFTMEKLSGDQYYNATALDMLEDFNARVFYHIIVIDVAYNIIVTEKKFFYLGDIFPPNIVAYNVTDFKNGTLLFYANITDNMSEVMDPVILELNDEFFVMHQNSSGYWTVKIPITYGLLANYSIYSANDSIGNENGSKVYSLNPAYGLVMPDDKVSPNILIDPIDSHYKGIIEFLVDIDDHTLLQSGVNSSTVYLHINQSKLINSFPMIDLGELFYFELELTYGDSFNYWITASDFAGNNNSTESLNHYFTIEDNYIPDVTSWNVDYGNGTVDFFADIYDWPHNESSAFLLYTQNYFEPWTNITMIHITGNIHLARIFSLDYNFQSTWFYITAVDGSKNWFIPGLSDASNFTLSDTVSPVITFLIVNSTVNDGEITIYAYATDPYGTSNFVNNTFSINMSLPSNFIVSEMVHYEFYRYSITSRFSFGEQVTISVWVEDDAGNLGSTSKIIIIPDCVPPRIVDNGVIDHQNGSVTVWALVEESPYGSGLPDNDSAVYMNYLYMYSHEVPLIWNGTGNFYSFSLSGFRPGQGFTYNITAIDNMGNINSIPWRPMIIEDKVSPECLDFGMNQILLNHTSTQISCWVKTEDSFGNIKDVNITIECYDGSQRSNRTMRMDFNGSYYNINYCLLCNQSFNFLIQIYDEALNDAQVLSTNLRTLDFHPTEVIDHNVEFINSEEYIGKVRFWIHVNNPYDDHNIRLTVIDESLAQILVNRLLMESNGSHQVYDLAIAYLSNFSYIMEVIDPGVNAGFYYIGQFSNNCQMRDYWCPVIHESGIENINASYILIWANISDWGSGVSEVYLNYEFTSQGGAGGYGSRVQMKRVLMNFNQSHYTIELTFSKSGTLLWFIEAYDSVNQSNSSNSSSDEYAFIIPPPSILNLVLEIIIIVIIGTVLVIVVLSAVSSTYQKSKKQKTQEIIESREKLDSLLNIYMILVTTAVGLPIYSINNVMYKSNSAVRDILSGLSVGIDSFLESFHTDFLSFFLEPTSEPLESRTIENIRTSVIEKNKVQIQIISSHSYRIFIFMKEKPPEYVKSTFTKVARILEDKITLSELGVVDEAFVTPIVEKVVSQHFPIALLSNFHINCQQIKRIEESNQDVPVFLSRSTLNALKRLVIIKSNLDVSSNDTHAQISLFEKALAQNKLQGVNPLIFSEALNIFTKILKINTTEIYKALWLGCTPGVDIIMQIRQEENFEFTEFL